MTDDLQNYIKELIHLKKLGLISNDGLNELDELLVMSKELESAGFSEYKDVNKTEIKFVNTSENPDPIWAKDGDSGFDLRANFPDGEKEITLQPFERMLIPTGLYFELPDGFEMQVRPRSGHSLKTGLMVILGTVDTGYRGEVKVIVINLNKEPQKIEQGERIAQGVVASRISNDFGTMIKMGSIEELSITERGSGGFGSTGKN
jgi:dUTP pyrophosphatase